VVDLATLEKVVPTADDAASLAALIFRSERR